MSFWVDLCPNRGRRKRCGWNEKLYLARITKRSGNEIDGFRGGVISRAYGEGGLLDAVLQDAGRAAVCAGRLCEASWGWIRDHERCNSHNENAATLTMKTLQLSQWALY